jgi:aryl-alcohol dehydrogenase-like predicted oxidoreductase
MSALVESAKKVEPGLGCVQLGLPYGNAAHQSLMPLEQAEGILDCAIDYELYFWDTASSYGTSEERIGAYLEKNTNVCVNVSTKIPSVGAEIWKNPAAYLGFVRDAISSSLAKLRQTKLGLLQFHQCDISFLSSASFSEACLMIKELPLAEFIGVSVYEPSEAKYLLDCSDVDYIQVPVNLIDRRFLDPSFLSECKTRNKRLIARSVFLQGVLIEGASLPSVGMQKQLERLRFALIDLTRQYGLSLEQAAIDFIFSTHGEDLDIALIGAHTKDELRGSIELVKKTKVLSPELVRDVEAVFTKLGIPALSDPRRWSMSAV